MPDQTRIDDLLEQMLASQITPEEACAATPELLPEIRARWERLQRVAVELDALFPNDLPTAPLAYKDPSHAPGELPQIGGYAVDEVIGRGGMGVVFRARQLRLNRPVALKMLLAGAHAQPHEFARFEREAQAVAALRHPNIVQIHDAGQAEGRPYFTMELVENGTLAERLQTAPVTCRAAAELVATLASAVQFAHQSGIVHRDLKPANIMLTPDGVPKIADFGLARFSESGPGCPLSGARVGTPAYMPPEQALGKVDLIGPAVDIYALGAILYEMLTGRPPFHGESAADTERRLLSEEPTPPSQLHRQVPRDLETICLKCLQKTPSRRYASGQDLADDLHRYLDGKPVLARPVGVGERIVKWARRRPALGTLYAALLIALGSGIAVGGWLWQREKARQLTQSAQEK